MKVCAATVQQRGGVSFGKFAELCDEYLRKGRKVYIEGKLQSQKRTDNECTPKAVTEIVLDDIFLLSATEEALTDDSRPSVSQALERCQLRFSIPNAQQRTKLSFSSVVRSRASATRINKSTGIWRLFPTIRFSKRSGL